MHKSVYFDMLFQAYIVSLHVIQIFQQGHQKYVGLWCRLLLHSFLLNPVACHSKEMSVMFCHADICYILKQYFITANCWMSFFTWLFCLHWFPPRVFLNEGYSTNEWLNIINFKFKYYFVNCTLECAVFKFKICLFEWRMQWPLSRIRCANLLIHVRLASVFFGQVTWMLPLRNKAMQIKVLW